MDVLAKEPPALAPRGRGRGAGVPARDADRDDDPAAGQGAERTAVGTHDPGTARHAAGGDRPTAAADS